MIEKIQERRQKGFEFLKLLYQKTVNENDRTKLVSVSKLSVELGFVPGENSDEMSGEERDVLFKQGKETETILLDLQSRGLIELADSANPYYGGEVGITDYGIWEIEDAVAGPPLINPLESKQRQLLQHRYNRDWLKEYEARYGEELYLHNQIKAEETAIAELDEEVRTLRELTTRPPKAPDQ